MGENGSRSAGEPHRRPRRRFAAQPPVAAQRRAVVTQRVSNPSAEALQGFLPEEKVAVDARQWLAVRRQMVRLVLGWGYAGKESGGVPGNCKQPRGRV